MLSARDCVNRLLPGEQEEWSGTGSMIGNAAVVIQVAGRAGLVVFAFCSLHF